MTLFWHINVGENIFFLCWIAESRYVRYFLQVCRVPTFTTAKTQWGHFFCDQRARWSDRICEHIPFPIGSKKKNTWNKHLWVRYMSLIVFYLQWFLKLIFLTLLRPSFKWLTITPLNERLMIFVFQENPNYHQVSCLDLYIAWKAVTLCTINQRLHYICGDQERSLEI